MGSVSIAFYFYLAAGMAVLFFIFIAANAWEKAASASSKNVPQEQFSSVRDYDNAKWATLVEYDEDVGKAEETIRPLGQKWVDELAWSYLSIKDKTYLPKIVAGIKKKAEAESRSPALEAEERPSSAAPHSSPAKSPKVRAEKFTAQSSSADPATATMKFHPAVFSIAYIVLMLFTYALPWMGSNSVAVSAIARSQGGINPFFWIHLAVWIALAGLAFARGRTINQGWLVILPVLGAIFDLVPGLNWIPMVPTILNVACIIFGVALRTRPVTE